MDAEAFIRWAREDARTVEELYTVELIVEQGLNWWHSHHRVGRPFDWRAETERKRQRALNPAYRPKLEEEDLRRAAEMLPKITTWWHVYGYNDRPVRDLKAFAFLTELVEFKMGCHATDASVFATLPKLRLLHFGSPECDDLSPLAGCQQLQELHLSVGQAGGLASSHWPKVTGLERLTNLENLALHGNLLAFAPGIVWPKVRTAALCCAPLAVRSVRDLPQVPACEILTLSGVERLDGIEAMPRLRNLTLGGDTRSFAPLEALQELTCFTCSGFAPLDVRLLTRLPKLQCAVFNAQYQYNLNAPQPRDFSPFTDSPMLRELHVIGCPPVEAEVSTLNELLLPWDDVLLAAEPRRVPQPLRMIVADMSKAPRHAAVELSPDDHGLADEGLRKAEGRWVGKFIEQAISGKLGCRDWGKTEANGLSRAFMVTIEAYAVVEKFAEIIEAIRVAMARLRHEYGGTIMIHLIAPAPEPTPAQMKLQKQFNEEQEQAEYEQRARERQEHLERLHRYELKKQLGEKIKPEDFVVPPPAPPPEAPWEREEEDVDDEDAGTGEIALKEKVEPPPDFWDNEHPLADKYRLMVQLTLSELWIMPHHRDLASYLMRREPDEELPDNPATA